MCSPLNPLDCPGQIVQSVVGDAIEKLAVAVQEMFGKAVSALGTLWVYIGTPNLTDNGGASSVTPGSSRNALIGAR